MYLYTARLNVHAHRRAPRFSRCQAELLIALTRSISRAVIQTTHPIFDTSYPPVCAADVFPMPMKGDAASRCARVNTPSVRVHSEYAIIERARAGTDTIPH